MTLPIRPARIPAALALGLLAAAAAAAELPRQPAPENAAVYFISPADGTVVSSPVAVKFGLRGMGVAPAGLDYPHTGHHHLLIDAPEVDMGLPLPKTEQIRHFGGGQTEASLELTPGAHTLQLLLGDYLHIPHDPPVMSDTITVTVE